MKEWRYWGTESRRLSIRRNVEEAVKLAMTVGVGVSEAARRLSISMKTSANWVRAGKPGTLAHVGQHQRPLTEIEAELARVKRELAELTMERDLRPAEGDTRRT